MCKRIAAADGAREEFETLLRSVFRLAVALEEGFAAPFEGEVDFEGAEVDRVNANAAISSLVLAGDDSDWRHWN